MSLRLRLMLLAAICVLPAALLLGVTQLQLRGAREADVRREIAETARSEADYVAGIIRGADQMLSALQLSPPIRERNAPYCSAVLNRLTREHPDYASIAAIGVDGRSFCTNVPGRAVFAGDRSYFRAAVRERRFVVGEYETSPMTDLPVLPVARPIVAPDETLLGVLVLSLSLGQVAQELQVRLPSATTLTVVDRNRKALLQVPDATAPSDAPALTPYARSAPANWPLIADIPGVGGHAQIIARAPVGDDLWGLQVFAIQDSSDAFRSLREASRNGAILIGVALALALLVAGWMARRSVRLPIRDLLATADCLRDGDFAARTTRTAGRSELARLGRALNELASALEQREGARTDAEERSRQLAITLEERVADRTRELAEANARLAAEAAERQSTQAALAQSQKLEAIGKLTGGVAHDFNNLLSAILGSIELAMRRTTDAHVTRLLAVAAQAAERGARLTGQMLAFSRKQDLSLRAVDINQTINGMSDLLRRTIGPLVRVTSDLADDLWLAMADQVQLELAVLNLAVNAQDAMPDGGSLHLRTRNVTVATANRAVPALHPGDYAMLSVSDTGCGMPPEVVANAFEPFFTTKEPGKGTGLGLSMIYGFAKQAGGAVTIESSVDQGTAVSLYLPRARAVPVQVARPATPATPGKAIRILLVDDDPAVRATTKEMLVELGHDVVEAQDGPAALKSLQEPGRFALLIADYAMPGMTGADVASRARDMCPDLAILFVTGYVDSDRLRWWSQRGYRTLNKPFHVTELTTAIQSALELQLDPET